MHGAIRQQVPARYNNIEKEINKGSGWIYLPKKSHIAFLFFSRLFDFMQITTLQSYILDQVSSFDSSLSSYTATKQVGLLNGGFTASQAITSIVWGSLSDIPWIGRKPIFLFGLLGSSISCVGLGFSQTFTQALGFRVLAGAINGNGGIRYNAILLRRTGD